MRVGLQLVTVTAPNIALGGNGATSLRATSHRRSFSGDEETVTNGRQLRAAPATNDCHPWQAGAAQLVTE
jgi:hypothetical protein